MKRVSTCRVATLRVAASEGELIDRILAVLPARQNIWNVAGNTTEHVAGTLLFDPLKKAEKVEKATGASDAFYSEYARDEQLLVLAVASFPRGF